MSEVLIDAEEIVVDDFVYARDKKDSGNVAVLVDKLKVGTVLDPVEVQQVSGYGEDSDDLVLLINGGHRLDAYEEFNKWVGKQSKLAEDDPNKVPDIMKAEPTFIYYNEEVLDYEEHKSELAIRAHNANDEQGLNSRPQDTKKIARNLCNANPEWTEQMIGDALRRQQATISVHVSDIMRERRASIKSLIMRLSCLGWTQEAVGEVVDRERSVVARIVQNIETDKIHNFYEAGKTPSQIAEMLDLDIQTIWHFILKDMEELKKFEKLDEVMDDFNINPCPYDVMNYKQCLPLTGTSGYAGQIPGQIVLNMLYYFTQPGDVVIDPMVGGGTTIDACLIMNRKCFGFDKKPVRKDVIIHDITGELPEVKKAQMVFFDPPYFVKKEEEYDLPEELRVKAGFMEFAQHWVRFSKGMLKDKGYVALLISDYVNYDDPDGSIFSDEYARLFEADGFKRLYKLSYPLTTAQYKPHHVEWSRENKQFLIRGRDLYVLQRS